MRKRINYTGRKKIPRSSVKIALVREASGTTASFEAVLNLVALELPPESPVWIEAYHQTQFQRFAFGTVGRLTPPVDRQLTTFGNTDNIHFRVKVVAADEPRKLLAEADQIPNADPDDIFENRISLLHLRGEELGHEIWRLALDGPWPTLVYNSAIPNAMALIRDDARFLAFAYPMIVRQVLNEALTGENSRTDDDDDTESWQQQWIKFAIGMGVSEPPDDSRDDSGQRHGWINSAVAAFCGRNEVLKRLVAELPQGDKT